MGFLPSRFPLPASRLSLPSPLTLVPFRQDSLDRTLDVRPQGVTLYVPSPYTAYLISDFGISESLSVPVNIGWNRFPHGAADSRLTRMGVVR